MAVLFEKTKYLTDKQFHYCHFNPENEQFDHFILQDKYGKDIVDSRPEMYIYEDVNGSLWVKEPKPYCYPCRIRESYSANSKQLPAGQGEVSTTSQ